MLVTLGGSKGLAQVHNTMTWQGLDQESSALTFIP